MRYIYCSTLMALLACGTTPGTALRPDAMTDTRTPDTAFEAAADTFSEQTIADVTVDALLDATQDAQRDASRIDVATTDAFLTRDARREAAADAAQGPFRCDQRVAPSCQVSPAPCADPTQIREVVNGCWTSTCISPAICACSQDVHCGLCNWSCVGGACVPCETAPGGCRC